ncbi:MAG: TonB-dependent receptor [Tannerella sp.]|nr:TonB-dependent receptor [Tannerella sp.]
MKRKKCPVRVFLSRLMFTALLSLAAPVAFAQGKTLTGVVIDETGEPVTGANVVVAGTTNGIITDIDGNFRLFNVAENAKIRISYIGYITQEISVDGKTHVQVQLAEDTQALEEVVVVGYGVRRKSDVTGALARVTAEELSARPVSNAFEALQGKIAGVDITSNQRPGEVGKIFIRGKRSLPKNSDDDSLNDPLYVVDGVPLNSGSIDALNPRDIESVDILKDASATAIYGSRGANGVVLVTTKRGKTGAFQLNYSGAMTVENIHDLAPSMNAADYITWRRWAYHNSAPEIYSPGDQPVKEQDQAYFEGDRTALANVMRGWASGSWDPSKVLNTDWTDFVTQTGITHEHSISASGGSDVMKTFASFGYLNNEGTQKGQEYQRYNATLNVDITPKPWITVGGSINTSWGLQEYGYSRTGQGTSSGPTEIYSAAKGIVQYAEPYDENGDIIWYPGGQATIYTIIDEWKKSNDSRQTFRALGSFYANLHFGKIWEPLDGLSYKINFGPDYRFYRQGNYIDSSSAARLGGTSWARWQYDRKFSWTLDNQVNYSKTLKEHRFDVTLLQTASKYNNETASMSAENIPKTSFKWNNMGSVDITSSDVKASIGSGLKESSMASYMARLNYAFMDKYLLTASGRYDGASVLAEGNKWHFFPSAALGWRLEQEEFIKNLTWISQLKLRLGIGAVGNSAVGIYETIGNIQSFYVPFGGSSNVLAYATNEPYYTNSQVLMANPKLSWEKTTQYNYGVDFGFFKGKVSGALDIYNSNTKDLLMRMTIPTLTGYNQTWANVGETKNFGVELSLNLIPVQTHDFMWHSNLNAAYQKNEVVTLANGKQDMPDNGWLIGESINIYYGYDNDGLWKDSDAAEMAKFNENGSKFETGMVKPVDQNGDYKIDGDDRVRLGDKDPRWVLGWSNTFTYKGIELAVELYGRMGYMVSTGGFGQLGMFNQVEIDYWTPSNPDAKWQKPIFSTAGGDAHSSLLGFQDASFVKFRNVSLGYIFPAGLCHPIGIGSLKIYGQLKNPGSLYSSIDFQDLDMGASYYNRGVTVGLQVGF